MSRTIGAQHVLQQKTYAVGPSPPPVEMFSPRPLSNVVVSPSALLAEVLVISYVSYPVVHGGGKVRELLQRQGPTGLRSTLAWLSLQSTVQAK